MAAWTEVSTLPYNFCEGSAVLLDGEIHILGSNTSDNFTKHYKYSNGSWTEVSTLPYSFYRSSAVVLDGEIHILGSNYYNNQTSHYKYSNGAWTEVSTLPYSFFIGSAVVLNGEIHILGGGSGNYTKHYKYSNGTWMAVSTLPYNFYEGSTVVLNGEIHILGSSYNSTTYTKHYKYSNGSWMAVSTLPYSFYSGSAVVLNGEIHILGSSYNSTTYTRHYKYSNGTWMAVSTLPYSFYSGSAVVLDGEIHILGSSTDRTKHYKYYTPINKVVYGDKTLLDLTSDTVTADKILPGYKAHDKSGAEITGSFSPDVITPSESGVYFTSGYKNMMSSGYAYSQKPTFNHYEAARNATAATNHTITDLAGKKILLLLFQWSTSSTLAYNRLDGATCDDGSTITKVCNLMTSGTYLTGTFYEIEVATDACKITAKYNHRLIALGIE